MLTLVMYARLNFLGVRLNSDIYLVSYSKLVHWTQLTIIIINFLEDYKSTILSMEFGYNSESHNNYCHTYSNGTYDLMQEISFSRLLITFIYTVIDDLYQKIAHFFFIRSIRLSTV